MKKIISGIIAIAMTMALTWAILPIDTLADNTGNVQVYRLNDRVTGEHLYTTDTNEVSVLASSGAWRDEGVFWNAPVSGDAVYRLNDPTGYHLYSMDKDEIRILTENYGWEMDNDGKPIFYSGGEENIYRLFNSRTGHHLLTGDKNEYDTLSVGEWDGEGVAFKALSIPERKAVKGSVICIDPGHQLKGDSTPEPNGPGSSVMKARVTNGTTGRTTGVPEYRLTLEIGLKLRDELESRGYTVVMTRETHDINISNMERAQLATREQADITVRIHANGSDNTSVNGALCMVPTSSNPYVAGLAAESLRLGTAIINSYCASTGMRNLGVQGYDNMTGINFCTMPVTIIEMGFMTNPSDDRNMQDASFQVKMVNGIADGIDQYF